jgi:hypothetical protein
MFLGKYSATPVAQEVSPAQGFVCEITATKVQGGLE